MIGLALPAAPQLSASVGALGGGADGRSKPTLQEAAKGLESVFLSILLKEMRQTLEPGSLFGKDSGDVYGGLFDQFMAQHLSSGKGMGIAQSLMKQLEPATTHEPSRSARPLPT